MANNSVTTPNEVINPAVWPQSPRLTPNTSQAVAGNTTAGRNSFGQNSLAGEAQFLLDYPRVNATATATITGSVANGDSLTLAISNPVFRAQALPVANPTVPSDTRTITITAASGDTVSNLVEKFILGINADAVLSAYGIYATGALGVLTLNSPGPVGNFTTWTESVGTGSETITLSAASLSGGGGSFIPFQGFSATFAGMNFHFNANEPRQVSPLLLAALVNSGSPIC